jgi:hypothetical protein
VIRKRNAILLCAGAIVTLAGALACFLKAFGIAFTVGDSEFVPDSACNLACREAWKRYGKSADIWFDLSAVALILTIVLAISSWKVFKKHPSKQQASLS